MKNNVFSFAILLFAIFACQKASQTTSQNGKIRPNQYAKGFLIEDFGNYKILSILQPYTDRSDTLRFVLSQEKSQVAASLQSLPFIQIPISRMVSTSTTHIALLEALGSLDVLKASNSLDYTYSEKVQNLAQTGKIVALANEGIELEKILALQPNLLMVSGMQASQMANYQKIVEAGVPVLINSEWLEQHPLGKAEWIRVMGILLNKEKEAEEYFNRIARKYQEIRNLVRTKEKKTKVAIGTPQKEQWYVPAGESFGSVFLKDAGASYIFMDNKGTGSLQMSRELVFSKFADAEVWLNAEMPQPNDSKFFCDFQQFLSVKNNKIYDRQKRTSSKGGNDYWESAVIHPELVLADLVKILYPELLPEHELFYYRQVQIDCK
jgi:iron complex transport system substrate-binding protein